VVNYPHELHACHVAVGRFGCLTGADHRRVGHRCRCRHFYRHGAALLLIMLVARPALVAQPPGRLASEPLPDVAATPESPAPGNGLAVDMFGHLPPELKLQMFQRLAAALGRIALVCEATEPQLLWLEQQRLQDLLEAADQAQGAGEQPHTAEQSQLIAAIFEKLDAALVDAPNGPRQLRRPANAFMDDLEQLALWQLERRLSKELSDHQLKRLLQERQARQEFVQEGYDQLLEWVIDREVILKESQAAAIRAATQAWIEQHGKSLQFYASSDTYVPDISVVLKPLLDPQQADRWAQARAVNVGVGRNVHWSSRFREILLEADRERRR
jgi:hypothetical protein